MKGSALAVLLAVMILIVAGAGYLLGENSLQNRTVTSTTTKTATTASSITSTVKITTFYPDLGSYLRLRIEVNGSAIHSHGAIEAQVILTNPFSSNLTATVPYSDNSTVTTWNGYDFLCGGGTLASVVSFAVFQGDWGAGNISHAGKPLTMAPPIQPPCAIGTALLFLVYLPMSSTAWGYSSYSQLPPFVVRTVVNATTIVCATRSGGGTSCGPTSSLFGYWSGQVQGPNGNYTTSSPDFHYFPTGSYTIAAEDAWGHQAFSYFEVT